MPGPTPKPEDRRRRRNKPVVPTLNLSADGRDGDPPNPLEDLDDLERRYYDWAWATPAALAWHDSDAEVVAEWARLKVYATRCLRGEITKTMVQQRHTWLGRRNGPHYANNALRLLRALYNFAGAAYDAVIYTVDFSVGSLTDVVWIADKAMPFSAGDKINITWANTNGRTYGLKVFYRRAR